MITAIPAASCGWVLTVPSPVGFATDRTCAAMTAPAITPAIVLRIATISSADAAAWSDRGRVLVVPFNVTLPKQLRPCDDRVVWILRREHRRFARRLAILSIIFLCVLVAPASAFNVVVRANTELAPGAGRTVTASCRIGEHAAFGGVRAEFGFGVAQPGVIPTNLSLSSARGVTAIGQNVGTAPGSLTAVAFCAAGPGPARTTVSKTASVAARGGGAVTATCPAGTVLVGGGFHAPVTAEIYLTRLERTSARAWRVAVANFTFGAVPLTAIAYCGAGPVPQQALAIAQSPSGGQPFNVAAVCPVHTSLVFGGLRATNLGPGFDPVVVLPISLEASSSGSWRVDGVAGFVGGGSLQALAYCR